MVRPPLLGPWICPRCTSRGGHMRRRFASVATATATTKGQEPIRFSLASHSAPGKQHDDQTLRQVFDSQEVWKEFSQRKRAGMYGRRAGLFQNLYLTTPNGFKQFAEVSLEKARKVVVKVLEASSTESYRSVVRDMDRLSDLLCRVIDIADFVRSTHPDARMRAAAAGTHALMFEYMNVLNTTTGLNDQLKRAMANPEVTSAWTEEEMVVAKILKKDFANSAIDLPPEQRQRFVSLSNEINRLGVDFVDDMKAEKPYLRLAGSKLKGLDPRTVRQMQGIRGNVSLPSVGALSTAALRTVEDGDTRRQIYMASRTASKTQLQRLEDLLSRRAELAKLSGYSSYGDMALGDKMAKSPESVDKFLKALLANNQGRVQEENSQLLDLKLKDLLNRGSSQGAASSNKLEAWDRDYYASRQLQLHRSKSRTPDFLSAYFSLGTVMQGLSRLFNRLYGVRFVPRETHPGETWNDDVRCLDIMDEKDGHIAVVYCDLFERAGKNPNPAHFTLRCSRRISRAEVDEAASEEHPYDNPVDAATDGMASATNSNGDLYQLPTIALICDFSIGAANQPTLLTFREVQTLFHEMGHAVHSMLGRTTLQNVSGTRCATDFAELPSVLMEHFASSPEVLDLFARHWKTDKPLPYHLITEKMELARRLEGGEIESQVLMAMLDQQYHSHLPLVPTFDTTKVYQDVYGQYGSIPEPSGTRWQGFFGHLYGYGATYYSYLFDRAIARKVWEDVFQSREKGPVCAEAGSTMREEVLKWGGGRDGWKCIAGALDDQSLANGDKEAMRKVGEWGIKD
ncbi:MAG: inner nuclear membrane protein enriched at telomere/subtelomere region [Chaenotheca gracillima]|nr:MAG: inner nuclear membrane protein enriched at telomere/subtelomere region [Chaenotheca gracillima]